MAILSNFPEKRGLNTDDINDIASGEISNGFIQSSMCYSTEEKIVGKWIDGKPLYQKTFDFGSNINIDTSSWTVISSIDTSNIALIVDNTCTRADGVNYIICVSPLGTGNKLELKGCTTNPSIRYCTIQYIKKSN